MDFKTAIEELRYQRVEAKFPENDREWIDKFWYESSVKYKKGNTASKIEKNIIEYMTLCGFQAEKRAVMGRQVKAPDVHTSMGTLVGKSAYIKSTSTKGSADISGTVYGLAVYIEVKKGKDRQSADQKKYEAAVKKAGGFYFIAHDEEDFYVKFEELLQHPKMVLLASIE